jgi:hypothetical protein
MRYPIHEYLLSEESFAIQRCNAYTLYTLCMPGDLKFYFTVSQTKVNTIVPNFIVYSKQMKLAHCLYFCFYETKPAIHMQRLLKTKNVKRILLLGLLIIGAMN